MEFNNADCIEVEIKVCPFGKHFVRQELQKRLSEEFQYFNTEYQIQVVHVGTRTLIIPSNGRFINREKVEQFLSEIDFEETEEGGEITLSFVRRPKKVAFTFQSGK